MSDDSISEPGMITSLLGKVQQQRSLLLLSDDDDTASEPSLLLECDPDHDRAIIDAPRNENLDRFKPGSDIHASTQVGGAELRFDSRVIEMIVHDNSPALAIDWPRRVLTKRRRKSFRVHVSHDRGGRVDLYIGDDRPIRGQLIDLSLGGFGALIDRDAPLEAGERIESSLEVDGVSLSAVIEVLAVRPVNQQLMRINGAFIDPPPHEQAQLERVIRALERQSIRLNGV